MSNFVEVLNLETGERGSIRRDWFENPVINAGVLVEVDAAQKPYIPELYKSKIEPSSEEVEPEEEDEDK